MGRFFSALQAFGKAKTADNQERPTIIKAHSIDLKLKKVYTYKMTNCVKEV